MFTRIGTRLLIALRCPLKALSKIRDDGKKAEIIGVLKEGFKRSFLRDGNGNDYIYKEGTTANIVLPILDAIEKRCIYDLKEQEYIVLSNWK